MQTGNEIPPEVELTWEEIARLANRHTLAVQFWLDTRAPQAESYQSLGAKCGSTGIQLPLLNQALGANYPEELPSEEIRQDIETIRDFFARRRVYWYWWISPFCRPKNIHEYLDADEDQITDDSLLPAMIAFVDPANWPKPLESVEVWQAETLEDLKAASTIRRTGFNFPEGVGLDYFEAMSDSWLGNDDKARLFIGAAADGPPASVGALIYAEGIPGVYVMATLPEWERQGLGTAILHRIMTEAHHDGQALIALTASRYGFGLYKKFGFEHIFDYRIYENIK